MDSDFATELDLSGLTANDANELRALFTTSATVSRKGDRSAQESFLVGLAGLMDSYLADLELEQDETPTQVAEYEAAGAVDLTELPMEDLLHGARTLIGVAQDFESRGRRDLSTVFSQLASGFAAALQAKNR
ncbi:MAG: hypothetical protein KDC27_02140 [Acidobacteria bacterium]|nr:hypothetical protein [Acidobacteriota bacterium]